MSSVPRLGLLLIAALALSAPVSSAYGDQKPHGMPVVFEGECKSADPQACNLCEVALKETLELPASNRSLTWSCPKMAAGRYSLNIAIPVKVVPAKSASPMLFQLLVSFAGKAHNATGYVGDVLPETPNSWTSWDTPNIQVEKTALITIDQDAAIDFVFKVQDAAYYIPRRTQGPAHRDGKLVIAKGEVSRLIREPTPESSVSADPGTARDFSAATLAKVIPGQTTKAEVEALLGQPWSTIAPDADEPEEPIIWEYRGQDSNGAYHVHIEFDYRDMTTLIAKIPDKTGEAPAGVAKTPPGAGKP